MQIKLDAKLLEHLNNKGIKVITLKKTAPKSC